MTIRSRQRALSFSSIFVLVSCVEGIALAQNARDIPIGGRTATMGGAGVAAGNDSAMPLLNPAGLAGIPNDVLAISASVYGYTQRNLPSPFAPRGFATLFGQVTDRTDNVESTNNFELPTSVAYFKHFGDPKGVHRALGVSLMVPTAQRFSFVGNSSARFPDQNGTYTETLSFNRTQTDMYIGPSYAISFGGRLRIGASLFVLYRTVSLANRSSVAIDAIGITGRSTRADEQLLKSFSIVPVLGGQFNATQNLWIGASIATPSLPVTGSVSGNSLLQQSVVGDGTASFTEESSSVKASAETRPAPRISIGAGWDNRSRFSVAADLHVLFAQPSARVTDGVRTVSATRTNELSRLYVAPASGRSSTVTTIGLSIGGELSLTKILAARAGFFTDAANSLPIDDPPADSDLYRPRYSRVGGTLGAGLTFGSFDSTFGLVYSHGAGHIGLGDSTSEAAFTSSRYIPLRASTSEDTIMIVLSGAVSVEEAQKKIRDVIPVDDRLKEQLVPTFGEPQTPPKPAPREPPPTVEAPEEQPTEPVNP
jgi:hypothetical protein